jgi:hypothetical protein
MYMGEDLLGALYGAPLTYRRTIELLGELAPKRAEPSRADNSVEPPAVGNAFQLVFAHVLEDNSGAGDEMLHRLGMRTLLMLALELRCARQRQPTDPKPSYRSIRIRLYGDLERELERLVLDCTVCDKTAHFVGDLGVRSGH